MKNRTKSNNFEFLATDVLSLILSFVLSYKIKFGDFSFYQSEEWMPLLYIVCLLNIVICVFSSPYSEIYKRPYYEEIIGSVLLTFYNFFASSIIFYVFKIGTYFSRQMILTMYGLYLVLSFIFKCLLKKAALSKKFGIHFVKKSSILIVCKKENIHETLKNASAADFEEYDFSGIYFTDDEKSRFFEGIPVVASQNDIFDFAQKNNIDEVLVCDNPYCIPSEVYTKLVTNGVGVHFSIENLIDVTAEQSEINNVGVYNTLSVGAHSFSLSQIIYLFFKRVADIVFASIGTLFVLPIALSVKIAYLIKGDKSRIFYTQSRVGKGGRCIKILKFRTMVPNAEELLPEILKDEKLRDEWEKNQKIENDPRITGVGKILRKMSLDELPQVINVLKGEMSLVGPRPLVPGELEKHNGMKLYNMMKPGITGWWGCNGRSNIDYRERLELEYYYVKNFSLYLDFLCVLRTVLSVLKSDGAK